jgi:hypothetical protein
VHARLVLDAVLQHAAVVVSGQLVHEDERPPAGRARRWVRRRRGQRRVRLQPRPLCRLQTCRYISEFSMHWYFAPNERLLFSTLEHAGTQWQPTGAQISLICWAPCMQKSSCVAVLSWRAVSAIELRATAALTHVQVICFGLAASGTWLVGVPRDALRAVVAVPPRVALAEAEVALAMPAALVDAHRLVHLRHISLK